MLCSEKGIICDKEGLERGSVRVITATLIA